MKQAILDLMQLIEEACSHYNRTAPIVVTYLEGLYLRMMDKPRAVCLTELLRVGTLREEGI